MTLGKWIPAVKTAKSATLWALLLGLGVGGLLAPATALARQADEDEDRSVTFFYPITGDLSASDCDRIRQNVDKLIETESVRFIVFELDTNSGDLQAAIETARYIHELDRRGVVTHAYVPTNQRAYSAGAVLALACKHLVMGKNSEIGNIRPVSTKGDDLGPRSRGELRDALLGHAREAGYPEALVEAMAVPELIVFEVVTQAPGGRSTRTRYLTNEQLNALDDETVNSIVRKKPLVDGNALLALTEQDALAYGFLTYIVDSRHGLIESYALPAEDVDLEEMQTTGKIPQEAGGFLGFLNHPFVKFLLITFGILGFVVELKVPGLGVPGLIGVGCFITFFVAGYFIGTVGWMEATLFVLALACLAGEVLVIPGFGIAGVLGLAFLFASLVLGLQPADQEFSGENLRTSIFVVMSGLASSVIGIFILLQYLPKAGSRFSGIVSTAVLDGSATPPERDASGAELPSSLLGRSGTVVTALRPAGKIEVEDAVLDVVTEGEFIDAGAAVEVTLVEGNRIVVRAVG